MHVSHWSNAQACGDRLPSGLQNLDGPLSFLHVLEVLYDESTFHQAGIRFFFLIYIMFHIEPQFIKLEKAVVPRCIKTRNMVFIKNHGVTGQLHLGDQEVNFLLNEDVHLLLKDGLYFRLAFAAQVGGGLRDSARHQRIALVGDFPGQVAGSLVDLRPL